MALGELCGRTHVTAAQLCGLSFEACRKRLLRCKQRLRREMSVEQKGGKQHVG